jgi:hypothetical protein
MVPEKVLDTALKTIIRILTRRLIDVGQDILIRKRLFNESFLLLSM